MLTGGLDGATVMIVDQKARLGIRKKVLAKVEANVCLCCDLPAHRRGLCDRHYYLFRSAQFALAPHDRPVNEARMIRAGKLLPSRQGQIIRSKNPFRKI